MKIDGNSFRILFQLNTKLKLATDESFYAFMHNINYCEQFYQRTNELVNNMSFGVAKTIQVVRYLFFRFKFENMGWKEAILSRFPTNFQLSRTCEL